MSRRKPPAAPELLPPPMPALPPPTPEEIAQSEDITWRLHALADMARRRNLQDAVRLAQQALAGHGPLIEHFNEIGRRYGHTLDAPPKPALRVIEGGKPEDVA